MTSMHEPGKRGGGFRENSAAGRYRAKRAAKMLARAGRQATADRCPFECTHGQDRCGCAWAKKRRPR